MVQVGGVFFTGALAFVLADTARIRLATTVAAAATVLLVGATYQLAIRRTGKRSLVAGLGQAGAAALLIAVTVIALPRGSDPTVPELVVEQRGYELRPSSFVDTNDEDKVDLDTGCPGWGDMAISLGPPRCGQLADLIVEETKLHSIGGVRLVRLRADEPATYPSCRTALREQPQRGVVSIRPDELAPGDRLCLETDLGRLALVEVERVMVDGVGSLGSLTIGFAVWRPPADR